MPPVNIRIGLYNRAIRADVDLAEVVNELLESYLDEQDEK